MTTPITPLPYESDVPDAEVVDMRRDFFDIWQKNVVVVRQVRQKDGEAGNYGSADETNSFLVDKYIRVNLQGNGTDSYTREKYGIDTANKSFHCYCLHTEDLKNSDRILYLGGRFIIQNLNQNIHHGQRVSWEFDLKGIDKDVPAFEDNTTY